MSAENHSTTTKPTLLLTLVNGTFGRGGKWLTDVSPGSFRANLTEQLRDSFQVKYSDEFAWGSSSCLGRYFLDNQMGVRLDSGEGLRKHLRDFRKPEGIRHYIIAHSHGGNVALYGLKDESVRNEVDGLVCLGTPFLISSIVDYRRDWTVISARVFALFAWQQQSWWLLVFSLLFWVVIISTIIAGTFKNDCDALGNVQGQLIKLRLRDMKSAGNDSLKLLSICTPRDEAFFLLRMLGRVGEAVRVAWSLLTRLVNWIGWILACLIGVKVAFEVIPQLKELDWIETVISYVDRWIMTPAMLIIAALIMGIVVLRLSYAYDSVPWIARFDTRTERSLGWPVKHRSNYLVTKQRGAVGFGIPVFRYGQ